LAVEACASAVFRPRTGRDVDWVFVTSVLLNEFHGAAIDQTNLQGMVPAFRGISLAQARNGRTRHIRRE
jgi:hypothetical protein